MRELTLLYPLSPCAVGRWDCEGLVSYLCRLATAHSITVEDVVTGCLAECTETNFRKWRHFSWWNRTLSVSVFAPKRTESLAESLALATGVNEVRRLSMASLNCAIDLAGLAAGTARHCPECVKENGFPKSFRPIVWDIEMIVTCPVHSVRLVSSTCGRASSDRIASWYRRQVPGVCSKCGSVGFACSASDERPVSQEEMWLAIQVGNLIASASAGELFSCEDVQCAVAAMANHIGAGYPYRAASVCGFSKARLFDWMHGNRRIKIKPLLALCAASGNDLLSALRGELQSVSPRAFRYTAHERPVQVLSTAELRAAILEVLSDDNCPSLLSVARKMGTSRQTLVRHFPAEVAIITERARRARHLAASRRHNNASLLLSGLVDSLREAGRPATTRNIFLESGILVTKGSRYERIFQKVTGMET